MSPQVDLGHQIGRSPGATDKHAPPDQQGSALRCRGRSSPTIAPRWSCRVSVVRSPPASTRDASSAGPPHRVECAPERRRSGDRKETDSARGDRCVPVSKPERCRCCGAGGQREATALNQPAEARPLVGCPQMPQRMPASSCPPGVYRPGRRTACGRTRAPAEVPLPAGGVAGMFTCGDGCRVCVLVKLVCGHPEASVTAEVPVAGNPAAGLLLPISAFCGTQCRATPRRVAAASRCADIIGPPAVDGLVPRGSPRCAVVDRDLSPSSAVSLRRLEAVSSRLRPVATEPPADRPTVAGGLTFRRRD